MNVLKPINLWRRAGGFVIVGLLTVFTGFSFDVIPTHAAPLNYAAATTITLTSPSIDFVIGAGSEANLLTVNPGSIVAVVPVGSSFTLTSASRDISVAEGVTSQSSLTCSGGIATLSVTSANTAVQTLTITPTADPCSAAAAVVSTASGGGGGGGGGYVPPLPPAAPVQPLTPQAQLQALLAQLNALQAQLAARGGTPQIAASAVAVTGGVFSKSFGIGSKGTDVKNLQSFLIGKKVGPAALELGKVGATGIFGQMTKKALAEYQKSVNISATGYFGPLTRGYINKL